MSRSIFSRVAVRPSIVAAALLFVFGGVGTGFAADVIAPFSLHYQGRESLILH
jgi:hypothetical protein